MENQSNISCEGHTEYLPLNDSSVSDTGCSQQRIWIFITGGNIFLFQTVAQYGLFAALYSGYL